MKNLIKKANSKFNKINPRKARKGLRAIGILFFVLTAGLFGYVEYLPNPHAGHKIPEEKWSFNGLTGHFDIAAMQRGFQVYREVCSACHSLKLVSYRNLADLGYSNDEIKSIAAEYKVTDGPNDEGDMFERAARPSDKFVGPYANDNAARASNGGALPPDLSLMTKARHQGSDYTYHLLLGYEEPPEGFEMNTGMHYNTYFPGNQIAMPKPLSDGQVTYADGTESSVQQMAWDVVNFLTWAAEPNLEKRHKTGVMVLIFLVVFTGLLYKLNKKVWKPVKDKYKD